MNCVSFCYHLFQYKHLISRNASSYINMDASIILNPKGELWRTTHEVLKEAVRMTLVTYPLRRQLFRQSDREGLGR